MDNNNINIKSYYGIIFFCSIWFMGFLGVVFYLFPIFCFTLLFGFFISRWSQDICGYFWFHLASGLLELFCGVQFKFFGKQLKTLNKNEGAVIILNHRTCLDWLFFWTFMLRYGNINHFKIILKESLKRFPALGWAMQHFGFIFLKRNWNEDEKKFTDILSYYTKNGYPIQLLIFPEGTDFNKKTKSQSDEFARNNQLQIYQHLLHPRTKGLYHCLTQMNGQIKSIWDMTIGYPDIIPQNEKDIFEGNFPKQVHFHFKRHDISTIPKENHEEFQNWFNNEIWKEKEILLDTFYKEKQFKEEELVPFDDMGLKLKTIIFFWVLFTIICLLTTFIYPKILWYILSTTVIYFVISNRHGFDQIQVLFFKYFF